jgi:predicted DNA-binding protein with PD1-like motif
MSRRADQMAAGADMLIKDFRQGRVFLASLDHGADIIGQIAYLADKKGIRTAVVSGIGALSRAELSCYDQAAHKYSSIRIDHPVELASLSGNISLLGEKAFVHAHAVLSDESGRTLAGHLTSGTIFAAEVCLEELLGLSLSRSADPVTGLNLWSEQK